MRAPPSRFSNNALTGTRVPLNSHSPLTLSAERSTAEHCDQSSMVRSYVRPDRAASGQGLRPIQVLICAKTHYVNPVSEPETILIAGPTASGKSALALAL